MLSQTINSNKVQVTLQANMETVHLETAHQTLLTLCMNKLIVQLPV